MKLIVLGSGTSVPHPNRCAPGFWIETSGGSILLDSGVDSHHRMAQEKLDWPNLDAVWISHFHLDHFGGLTPFLFGMKWAPQTANRTKPLQIFGPPGIRSLLDSIDNSNNYRLFEQRFPVGIIEVEPGQPFLINSDITGDTLSTPHTKESLALRLTEQSGKTMVYTSDTSFSQELITFASKVDLLLMECSFRRNKSVPTHLELAEAMELAQASAPKVLVLTHLYPEWDTFDVASEAQSFWPGQIHEATDGLRLTI